MAKSAAHLAGYPIPGHTEFLQELSGAPITRMAFVSPRLNVVLHTVHQSLRSVVEGLDSDAVAETLIFSAHQFMQLTGKSDLRVALCAMNPHAGEEGPSEGKSAFSMRRSGRLKLPCSRKPSQPRYSRAAAVGQRLPACRPWRVRSGRGAVP